MNSAKKNNVKGSDHQALSIQAAWSSVFRTCGLRSPNQDGCRLKAQNPNEGILFILGITIGRVPGRLLCFLYCLQLAGRSEDWGSAAMVPLLDSMNHRADAAVDATGLARDGIVSQWPRAINNDNNSITTNKC